MALTEVVELTFDGELVQVRVPCNLPEMPLEEVVRILTENGEKQKLLAMPVKGVG